ncbi:MAG: NAD(P)H-quinone oxidoreductase [SAR202 cluster bacterium Io17-Chloro-G9]|nr:MAG: NAD(P)H-quinone oxidoreductase [SAR202 cluster bacterium Io17-Chloro-G9]
MRAALITEPGKPEVLRLQEIEDPIVGADDVMVEVKASALNRADLAQRQGNYPSPPGIRGDVPGLEFSGVVMQVGARAIGVKEGDRVFGLLGGGGYATRIVTHHRMAMPMPANLDFAQAAAVPEVFFTAYDALFNHCGLKMGERVLIHAAGSGIGTAAIQLAHNTGAHTFGTAGTDEKLASAANLGLDETINYRNQDFAQVIQERTKGDGVNVILDVVGAPYWEANLSSLAVNGRLVLVGTLGGANVETSLGRLMPKRLSIHGTVLRPRPLEEKIALTNQFKNHVLPLIAQGRIKAVVDRTFPLADASLAHEYMETNANFGKIVLTMD